MAEFQKTVGFLRQAAQTPGKLGAAQLLLLQRDDEVKLAREVGGEREDFLACAGLARLGQSVLLEPCLKCGQHLVLQPRDELCDARRRRQNFRNARKARAVAAVGCAFNPVGEACCCDHGR